MVVIIAVPYFEAIFYPVHNEGKSGIREHHSMTETSSPSL